jgi:uncharacterized protein (DUF2062 family)
MSLAKLHRDGFDWHNWHAFFGDVGKPLVVGGFVCAAPFAVLAYFLTRRIVIRHELKKKAQTPTIEEEANPS